ncbi:hypothetical protein MTP02_22230 [Streptomyces albus]|nr:hypothetical protein MTP02_22230 [Streptomyces albus]
MQPVGTFIVAPPTLYSKVWTGADPAAPASACEELVSTSVPATAIAVTNLDTYCVATNRAPSDGVLWRS